MFNENFNFLQREWAFLYGIPIVKLKVNIQMQNLLDMFIKLVRGKKLKKISKYFEKLWLGYKFDDKIYDKNIKDQLNTISITQIEKELEIDSI